MTTTYTFNPNGEVQEQEAKETNVREWYMGAFPTDECGRFLNPNATFYGLFETLDNHGDIYDYIWEHDSVIRERLFAKLADIMDCDYDYIYEQWVQG